MHLVLGLFGDSTGAISRLLWRKIAASVDGDDKEKKNSSGIQFNRFFLYTQFGSVYLYTARQSICKPGTCTTSTPAKFKPKYKAGLEFLGPALYPTNMVLRVTLP